jgi:hypothetical protein
MAKKKLPSFDELDIETSTMAMWGSGGKGSTDDPNIYHGTYKGKQYIWHKGKAKEVSKPKPKPSKKPMSFEDALKKYGNDVTKIPGNSRGKRVQ